MRVVASAFLAVAVVALPAAASADLVVAAEFDYAGAETNNGDSLSGFGPGVRVGWTFDLPLLRIEPEVGASKLELDLGKCPEGFHCTSMEMDRVFAGARVGLGTGITPGAFVRASYGWADAGVATHGGTILEAGAFLDFRLFPLVELGVHGQVGKPDFDDDVIAGTFWGIGAHVGVTL